MATGDEWKGEDPEQPRGGFFMFGGQQTAEEKAHWERTAVEGKAKGDLLGAMLPAYDAEHHCTKCGHDKARTFYCKGADKHNWQDCYEYTGNHEHLHRECKRCSYRWYEKTLTEGDA